ncbi:hypothetical protein [Corynebacterium coyleae]|uniref:hypothetical protein n=1 Tax=Corynebacterium coyleae TaxID=53374 RepID=UPI0015E0BAE9|nr:hypothetical protein [Corynebacterium coyleae]
MPHAERNSTDTDFASVIAELRKFQREHGLSAEIVEVEDLPNGDDVPDLDDPNWR